MYATTKALVDDILPYYDNTDADNVPDATVRQAKVMAFVNRVRDELWWWRDHRWTYTSSTVTMSSGEATFPTSFAQMGSFGGLFSQGSGIPWVEVNWQEMQTLRKRGMRTQSKLYAIGTTIQIPNTSSSETLDIVYRLAPTTLTYGQGIAFTPMPSHFIRALLLGTVARLKEEEGDTRDIWREDYLRAVSDAFKVERETSSRAFQMPQAVGGMW